MDIPRSTTATTRRSSRRASNDIQFRSLAVGGGIGADSGGAEWRFSNLLKVGSNYQIYDPFSTTPVGNGQFSRTPLPNNIIPATQINPVAANIAKLWDHPNQQGTADGTNNYTAGRIAQDTLQQRARPSRPQRVRKGAVLLPHELHQARAAGKHPPELTDGRQLLSFQPGCFLRQRLHLLPRFFHRCTLPDRFLYRIHAVSRGLGPGIPGVLASQLLMPSRNWIPAR